MPIKPPTGGSTHVKVDASTSPTRPAEVDIPLPGPSVRRGAGSGLSDDPQPRAGSSGATDLGVIRPAVDMVLNSAPVEVPQPTSPLSFVDYLVSLETLIPEVNSEGLRVTPRVTYAEVADRKIVPVRVDPETGLYRARRTSESQLGPVMLRDADSGLWYPREVIEPTTRAQVQRYLPETIDLEADAFIARFGDKDVADIELKRIQLGLAQLGIAHVSMPTHHNHGTGTSWITEVFGMWHTLRQLYKWQGQPDQRVYSDGQLSGFKLDINLTLWPVDKLLSLKFKSVVSLTLRGHAPLNPEVFFAQFPNIESLTVTSQIITRGTFEYSSYERVYSRFNLGSRFAEQLARLPHLRELNLRDCDLEDDFSVRGMTRLQVLRLGETHVAALNFYPDPVRSRLSVQYQNILFLTDPDISGMTELRVLDLTGAGIRRIPFGLEADNGPSRLEVLKLGDNPLSIVPSVKGMAALQELDLSNTGLDKFPESITSEIPSKVLNLANNRIASIPESYEIGAGLNLMGNPITDPASFRRLIEARQRTGIDVWLGEISNDQSADLWLQSVHEDVGKKRKLWNTVGELDPDVSIRIRTLSATPEFHAERPLLERRVWWFLRDYSDADISGRIRLNDILLNERSPGKMLDRLEADIRENDPKRQNPPQHHLPKRPRLD
ncbi:MULTISPECIES: leucine-rich repeat domain-containing protein [unclassified Pseudomonas]|uniref:leucine-rich repeat domain-containing protein n=1 Tax=unclassified Pseudomonas TaxID=196821 RepID=UPI002892AB78|nr:MULTISPECIES: leucine-rich repeat domain-containing protein [unclassified Pseudomonas]